MFELISSDEEEEKEHWQPRKKQKGFYFKGHLKAASKRLKAVKEVEKKIKLFCQYLIVLLEKLLSC
ncbi:Hypothetical protein CINCED_3A011430 [Cinara cedri]|uniref:Uncharacterized protein n=1 Tax=Cinara cedri TaxID=506608 RepID=A0A5E4M399_9HEMI|nr:Hypothetical protein CINCED_3A011430 [Cinara cedri]